MAKRIKRKPAEFERSSWRHRHPSYPRNRCGVQVIVRDDGKYQQLGKIRRKCWNCRKPLRQKDIV